MQYTDPHRKREPLVSVYITNFNYETYIRSAIESVLSQTYKNIELFIIDDGSTDNSRNIINKYSSLKNVFIIFQNNKGLNKTNNVALNLCNGEYIIRLDADDYFHPDAIYFMVKKITMSKSALVFPDYFLIDEENNIISQVKRFDFDSEVTLRDIPAHGACTLISIDILKKIGGYDESFTCQDGYDIWIKMISSFTVTNINKPLFYYRQHHGSLSSNKFNILKTRSKIINKYLSSNSYESKSTVAFIPIRGAKHNPKSISMKELNNKKLIDWTIDSVLSFSAFDSVIISSDDIHIAKHIESKYPSVIFHNRSPYHSALNTSLSHSLESSLDEYSINHSLPDNIMLIFIEYPFREPFYYRMAIDYQNLFGTKIVESVYKSDSVYYKHDGKGIKPIMEEKLRLERDVLLVRAGGIRLIDTNYFLNTKKLTSEKMGHIHVDEQTAFCINSDYQLKIAELIAKNSS